MQAHSVRLVGRGGGYNTECPSCIRALYTLKWRSFERWCAARQHDPINCALGVILEFLQQLFDEGKVASTLKVYMVAISACHAGINGSSPGSHPLASRFLAGVRRLRVPERHLIPSWDLLVVLRALTGPPFEPLETVDIKFVSLKTALHVTNAFCWR